MTEKVWEEVNMLRHQKIVPSVGIYHMTTSKVFVVGRFPHYLEII